MVTNDEIEMANELKSRGYSNKEIAKKLGIKKWQAKAITKGGANTPEEVRDMKSDYKKDKYGTFDSSSYDYSTMIVPMICM